MLDRRRALTAEQRLEGLRRDQERVRRQRLAHTVAAPLLRRMATITPAVFMREGLLVVRRLLSSPETVKEALRANAVFGLDTAMRLTCGQGFLAGGDLQAYLSSMEPIRKLSEEGLVEAEPFADQVLLRPWPGPPRLFAAVVSHLPGWCTTASGHRVVTRDRLARELIGAVGLRPDLFARLAIELPGDHHET